MCTHDHRSNQRRPLSEEELEEVLKRDGIRYTSSRKLIYDCIADQEGAMSLSDIEAALETVDKSTISRNLHFFLLSGIIHRIDDGTGIHKYAISPLNDEYNEVTCTTHFYCRKCGKTFCMDSVELPQLTMPEGFSAESKNVVIKGLCPSCHS